MHCNAGLWSASFNRRIKFFYIYHHYSQRCSDFCTFVGYFPDLFDYCLYFLSFFITLRGSCAYKIRYDGFFPISILLMYFLWNVFFPVLLWLGFSFSTVCCVALKIFCNAGFMVINCLSLCLPWNACIFLWFLKDNFPGYITAALVGNYLLSGLEIYHIKLFFFGFWASSERSDIVLIYLICEVTLSFSNF